MCVAMLRGGFRPQIKSTEMHSIPYWPGPQFGLASDRFGVQIRQPPIFLPWASPRGDLQTEGGLVPVGGQDEEAAKWLEGEVPLQGR